MPLQAPIMLALCSMLSRTYYAGNYARIIAASLMVYHPRVNYIINPPIVQPPYTLRSHGTTITCST